MTRKIDTHLHRDARLNIPPGEMEPFVDEKDRAPLRVEYDRRRPGLDPQLIWRGKGLEDDTLTAVAPPIYLQEQVHPKALIEDLRAGRASADDLFGHFGVVEGDAEAQVEFYAHPMRWPNRMILGDSLQVMASLAEREGLRGQVQSIYIDPPDGIRFNSNFQWSTTSRDVKDGALDHLTREPEQVKAFRDTWRDGIHSYLGYLRDRLTVARELLTESGSCFVQIGDENVHRVRALMDEVFGEENFVSQITFRKGMTLSSSHIANNSDFVIWYARDRLQTKIRSVFQSRDWETDSSYSSSDPRLGDPAVFKSDIAPRETGDLVFSTQPFHAAGVNASCMFEVPFCGRKLPHPTQGWKTNRIGMRRATAAGRLVESGKAVRYRVYFRDYPVQAISNNWHALGGEPSKIYVVQTAQKVVERCLLMTTDPGDLVLDPTCGSGTTAYVAEQWGRRWITIDTSRVALALARARIMGAKFPFYLLADSPEGRRKEADVTRTPPPDTPTHNDIRQGFVYERVPHITLKSIANNAENDVIWAARQPAVEAAREALNAALAGHAIPFKIATGGRAGQSLDFRATGEVTLPSGEPAPTGGLMEWEFPREAPSDWPEPARAALARFWEARIVRQKEIDASIAARAEFEYLYDKPYEDRKRVRVAGPFTVETLSPHRTPAIGPDGAMLLDEPGGRGDALADAPEAERDAFFRAILENLKKAGVHQKAKGDRIAFTAVTPWPGRYIGAEGRYLEGGPEPETLTGVERRAAIMVGPEYGTVQRADLVMAAREAVEAGFDLLVACAFNYDAHADLDRMGPLPILRARMNPDLHMAGELKAGGGNLFVVFGEPDVALHREGDTLRVEIRGVDVFRPQTGEIDSTGPEGIACWFVDTDYSGESFFVRHAYFLGAGDPYKSLRTTLKDEIDREAWDSLNSAVSRPFPRPSGGKVAVKAINHLGDEVMRVFDV